MIHPTAIVDRRAEIDPAAEIGAYAMVEGGVRIGPQCVIWPHAFIAAGTTLGRAVQVHPFAVVGHPPQDRAWKGAPSYTQVGDETLIREHVSVHRGTAPESTTVIGQRVFLMAAAHVAHNCVVEDDVVLANGVLLAGHVRVGRRAFLGGNAVVHQFCRIGELAMIGGGLRVPNDVPPFMMVGPGGVVGPNVVGLRRADFTSEQRAELRLAHRTLYRSGLLFRDAVQRVAETVRTEAGRRLVEFLQAPSKRGITGLKRALAHPPAEDDAL